jgi:archaellum component FlaC
MQMVKSLLQGFLGIAALKMQVDDINQKVEAIDQRVKAVEDQADIMLRRFGNYKNRATEELNLMDAQIGDLLSSVESLIERIKSQQGTKQAKALAKALAMKKKVKINKALIGKQKKARAAGG